MITRTPLGPRTPARQAAALLGAGALLLLPACGGDGGTDASTAATPSVSAPAATPSGPAGATPASPAPSSPTDEHAGHEGAVSEITITVAGGEVTGPGDRVEVPLESTVHLTVTSDTADEAHVHGYDETLDLEPGTASTVEFTADIPGVFEVELHESGLQLVSLQVQ